jgi:F-type H+-transporting ATPase subunit a
MSSRRKILFGVFGFYAISLIAIFLIFGFTRRDNEEFQPQNEFRLDTWVELGPFDINKAVMYLVIAGILTCVTMIWIARRMQARPNRVQTAVEALFSLMRDNITRGNLDDRMARKYFPFIGALFLFIWFNNLIGYIPLPTNTHETFTFFDVEIPSFALYAATANISVPLVLTLIVWISYHVEGVRAKGPIGYLKSWVPSGVEGAAAVPIFFIEVISHFVRLISLSVRLFANILAGHLLILFMGGGLVVLLGFAAIGVLTVPMAIVFFIFEVGLVATLQAFIFATLTSIYLGGAVADDH